MRIKFPNHQLGLPTVTGMLYGVMSLVIPWWGEVREGRGRNKVKKKFRIFVQLPSVKAAGG